MCIKIAFPFLRARLVLGQFSPNLAALEIAKDAYSVGELTYYIKHKLENDSALRGVWVSGEISNLTRHSSGHIYFTLKDEQASLSCVMFRNNAINYPTFPGHGQKISISGDINLYPPRGSYQLIAKTLKREGIGDLHQRFLALKDRLQKEGLFDPAHKKAIPRFPSVIGVVTSPTGAVIRDIINTLTRRFPHVKVILSPAKVQGEGAAETIVKAIDRIHAHGQADVILLCRGGGSLEDLWCFNEEILARRLFESEIPVIAGIGHETDFTISDFVADVRASTPTAAAELAVPDARELMGGLDTAQDRMKRALEDFILNRRLQLDSLTQSMENTLQSRIDQIRSELNVLEVKLHSLDMRRVLEQGYTLTLKEGKAVTSTEALNEGDEIETIYHHGRSRSTLTELTPKDDHE